MRTRTGAWAIGLAALLTSADPAAARAVDLRNVLNEYSLRSWGTKDGLPSSEVLAIAQDGDGFLWLGTDGGLVKFDGTRFTAEQGPAAGRAVRRLLVAGNGDLWVGLGDDGGTLRYRRSGPGLLTLVQHDLPGDGLAAGAVRAMIEDAAGDIWVGHLGGLFRHSSGRWRKWTAEGLEPEVHSLAVDDRGRLLVGARSAISRSASPDHRRFEMLDGPADRDEPVADISLDAGGRVWRTDPVHGVRGHVGRGRPAVPPEIARGQRLLHDRAGHLWVGTGGQGLWRVSERADGRFVVEQSTVTTGLLGNGVVSVFEDREGNIWAGTLDGLNRLSRYVATPITGLGLVSGIEVSPQGIWVMTADALQLFARGQPIEAPIARYRGEVKAIHGDEAGRLWMSTGDRLFWFDDGGRHEASLYDSRLQSIGLLASDRRGGLWVYDAQRGLHRRSAVSLTPAALPPGLQGVHLAWMDTTTAGVLWAGTTDGRLISIEPDGLTRYYNASDGLDGGVVRAWHLNDDGSLWLAGAGGLTLFKDGAFSTSRQTHGNRLELLTAIISDADGRMWIGMRSGLLGVSAGELREHMQAPSRQVPLAFLNKADGLAGNPRWYGHRGAILDDQKRLWFVTSRGLSIVDPGAIDAPTPVDARVDSVVIDGQVVVTPADARLAPGTRRLDIQFAALALTTPATLRFRYRLDGFDRDWVDAGAQRSALYTNLAPGPYTFHVMATNTDGTWPERAASWSFSAEPMFYQTVWFRALCLATVLGVVAMIWRLHLRRVRAEMSILLAERARVAREIHDTLLQGLFGVALRCDAIAAELHTKAPQVSSQFLDMRRGIEQYVREARQSILGLRSPVLEELGLAAALRTTGEKLAAGSGVRFEFASAGLRRASDPYSEEQLLRIGQEAIVNALRHAQASAVRAELLYRDDRIVLVVSDDGRGLGAGVLQHGDGLGLASMRDRARAAGGTVAFNSQAGHGTSIEVTVPCGP